MGHMGRIYSGEVAKIGSPRMQSLPGLENTDGITITETPAMAINNAATTPRLYGENQEVLDVPESCATTGMCS